jgi:hypothetical protein
LSGDAAGDAADEMVDEATIYDSTIPAAMNPAGATR